MPGFRRSGAIVVPFPLYFPLPLVTTAQTRFSKALGFQFELIGAFFQTQVAGTGSGATRTVQIKKNSTVVASAAITLAATSDIGEETVITPPTGDGRYFGDNDVLTVDFPNSGTAFTAGAGILVLLLRQRPQDRS